MARYDSECGVAAAERRRPSLPEKEGRRRRSARSSLWAWLFSYLEAVQRNKREASASIDPIEPSNASTARNRWLLVRDGWAFPVTYEAKVGMCLSNSLRDQGRPSLGLTSQTARRNSEEELEAGDLRWLASFGKHNLTPPPPPACAFFVAFCNIFVITNIYLHISAIVCWVLICGTSRAALRFSQ